MGNEPDPKAFAAAVEALQAIAKKMEPDHFAVTLIDQMVSKSKEHNFEEQLRNVLSTVLEQKISAEIVQGEVESAQKP